MPQGPVGTGAPVICTTDGPSAVAMDACCRH